MKRRSIFQSIKHLYPSLPYSEYKKVRMRFVRYADKIKEYKQIDPSYETYAYFRGLSEGRISINEQVRSEFLGKKINQTALENFTAEVRAQNFVKKHPEMLEHLNALRAGIITAKMFYALIDEFKKTRTYANRGGS